MDIRLVEFDESFITQDYLSWLNDSILLKYSNQSAKKHSHESCLQYLASFKNSPNFFWAIQDSNGEIYGTMTAYLDTGSNVADIGILVGKPSRGIGSLAWGIALEYLFEAKKVRKITAGTLSTHLAMISIFQKWGMQQEATLRQQIVLNGQTYDIVKYGILSSEWLRRPSVNNDIS